MPELQEVFEMVTKQTEPEVDSWGDQERRQRRAARNRKIGAFAVTAGMMAVVASILVGRDEPGPAPPEPGGRQGSTAEAVADGFVGSVFTFDVDGARSYLSGDADVAALVTSLGDEGLQGTPDELPLFVSMLDAMGFSESAGYCEDHGSSASRADVRCPFSFHLLGSETFGRGAVRGSYLDLTIRDGEIVRAAAHWNTDDLSPKAWEPFARWVARAHPEEAALMYEDDSLGAALLSRSSIRLWDERLAEFVAVFATNKDPGPVVGRISRVVDGVRFSLHVPSADWYQFGTISVNKSIVGPQGAEAIIFWTTFPDGATAEPCSGVLASSIDVTAADLAAVVSTAPGTELVAGPSDVSVGGHPAKFVSLVVREDAGCDPGYFFRWPAVNGGPLWLETPIGTGIQVWIVDVDGTHLVIEAETSEDADDGLYRDVTQIVESNRFE